MSNHLVFIAGIGQLALALSSLAIPRVLGWRQQMARLDPLTAQVFWIYAGYILGINLFFGALSTVAPGCLTDGTLLARTLCGFIALYWGVRLLIQVFAYRITRPKGRFHNVVHAGFTVLFSYLALVYGGVALALL
jgi:hypothetical protein